jgi:hypothetical protein
VDERQQDEPVIYEIRVRAVLDTCWASWFEGFSVVSDEHGDTVIRAPVVDQAALHGLLAKVRDLALPLVSVRMIDGPAARRPPP